MILYRPMDMEELRLVCDTGMKGFPPRKPEQPIFYPVLNLEYANEIAKRWNAEGQSTSGYVARFSLDNTHGAWFEPKTVGAARHMEFWVPAEELCHFNKHIFPPIEVVSACFGEGFKGYVPSQFELRGKDATAQFVALAGASKFSGMDFRCEIAANHTAVFLNYAFWMQNAFSNQGITKAEQERVLVTIQRIWSDAFPEIHLPLTSAAQQRRRKAHERNILSGVTAMHNSTFRIQQTTALSHESLSLFDVIRSGD